MKKDIRSSIIALCAKNKQFPSIPLLAEYTGQPYSAIPELLEKLCDRKFLEKLPSGNYQLNPFVIVNGAEDLDPISENNINDIHTEKQAVRKESEKQPNIKVEPKKFKPSFNKNLLNKAAKNLSKIKTSIAETNSNSLIIPIVRIVMLLIGLGAGIVSVFYTSVWLLEFLPGFLAILLSAIMVSFSVIAFEMIIMFLSGMATQHWTRWGIVTGFFILWLIVAAFSITSTVAGQYNQHIKNSKEYAMLNESKKVDSLKWNTIQERKKELNERRAEKKSQLSTLINISNQATTIETTEKHSGTLSGTNNRIYQAEQALNKIEADLEKIREEERKLLSVNPSQVNVDMIDIPDFYSWIAKVLNIKKDLAQFWLSLFPAIFVDIISPVALAVAMFLQKPKIRGKFSKNT